MNEEGIVEYLKLVIKYAQRVALRHFVAFTLPAQSLVVVRVHVGPNVDWFPMHKISRSLSYVENPEV